MGLAASLLQDDWKSIGGGVLVLWWEVCDQTMLSFVAGWNGRPRLCTEGEAQDVIVIKRPIGRGKTGVSRELGDA